MFYTFGFIDNYCLPLKNIFLLDTYNFEDEKLAMYGLLDIKVIISSFRKRDQTSNFYEFLSEEILFKENRV
jgi:hypothetical protein